MGQSKAKTLQERFGFVDRQLETPGHDAICCWVEENATELFQSWSKTKWSEEEIQSIRRDAIRKISRYCNSVKATKVTKAIKEASSPSSPDPLSIRECVWEPLIKNDRKFEVGFMDLQIEASSPYLSYTIDREGGFAFICRYMPHHFWIEVKTEIKSLGALFRQLSLYRENIHLSSCDKIVVVCPDDQHRKRIENQGYGFIHAVL